MPLDKMLSANRVESLVNSTSKKRILETMASLIASSIPSFDADELFQLFINRERLGSTGIGEGIAIPHCRCANAQKPLCAVITLEKPVDFEAADDKPVDIIFAMLVPEDADNAHLENLAALAEALQKPEYTQALRAADSNHSLFEAAIAPFAVEQTENSSL